MLHLVYGTNCPMIFASIVRYSLLHFNLSQMAVHHHLLHHLHYHHWHLLLLVQSFLLNLRLGSSANPFLCRPFSYRTDSTDSRNIYCFYFAAQRLDLFAWCVRLSRLLSRFSNAFKIHALWLIHSFILRIVRPRSYVKVIGQGDCQSHVLSFFYEIVFAHISGGGCVLLWLHIDILFVFSMIQIF